MTSKHSAFPRGLEAAGKNANLTNARFGRLFPKLQAATFDPADLQTLAKAMVSTFEPPKDGPDDEESGIPALYTYFGQFIDHDLTFDPNSSFQKKKDPDATEDFRTPAFDLDNVYGRGPGDQPYLYDGDGKTLLLGVPLTLGTNERARDLQRNVAGRALIGDPRNDENTIVSQLQGLVIRFHNGIVRARPGDPFESIQESVRHHYQYIVVNDFLARIVHASVLDTLKTDGVYDNSKLQFFRNFPPNGPFMPVEFSAAAYRLGHSMVRPEYRLNDATLLPIFPIPANVAPGFPEGLTGFRSLITDWGIDWGRFIDIDVRDYGSATDPKQAQANFKRLQFAYRIDTALVDPLGSLPSSIANNPPPSLALRNLLRGLEFGLPSGQALAKAMSVTPLADEQILIGQGVDRPDQPLPNIVQVGGKAFAGNCPLWTYVLAEAMHHHQNPGPQIPVNQPITISTPQLGPVGGRIVAEVFLGLLFADSGSYLNRNASWTPGGNNAYKLKNFVEFALGH